MNVVESSFSFFFMWRAGNLTTQHTYPHTTHNTCRARACPRVLFCLFSHTLSLSRFSRFSPSRFSLFFCYPIQVETFHHIAYKDTKVAANILIKQYKIADEAAEKDEAEHPLPNNASDSEKRDAELRRRVFVIFKSLDPEAIQRASGAIWSGCFAVVCALRVKFAHAVTLGVSIGDMTTGACVHPIILFCTLYHHHLCMHVSMSVLLHIYSSLCMILFAFSSFKIFRIISSLW